MKESMPLPPWEKQEGDSVDPEGFSRREFLKGLGAGVVASGFAAAPIIEKIATKQEGVEDREEIERQITELREKLRSERGIEIDFSPIFPGESEEGFQGVALESLIEKRDVCESVAKTLDLYPPFMHKETGLSIIRVMNDLKAEDWNSYTNSSKTVDPAGMTASQEGVMYFEYKEDNPIDPVRSKEGEARFSSKQERMSTILNHELFHFIENSDFFDRDDYEYNQRYLLETRGHDYEMDKMPPAPYNGEINSLVRLNKISPEVADQLREDTRGFARRYGKASFAEDRATVVEALYDQKLSAGRQEDTVLTEKMKFMKRYYFERSRGLMNHNYWELVHNPAADSELVSNYLKIQADIITGMSDEALVMYMKESIGDEVDLEHAKKWKQELRSWLDEDAG
ncbi:MAG: twin-arginine translocation signal domain-containing protein [Candidatus Pacebacteria bacterium]|nr:twin-arginine translocation signal domain-containing protein [Candidatus Paceibacterota bacterium]